MWETTVICERPRSKMDQLILFISMNAGMCSTVIVKKNISVLEMCSSILNKCGNPPAVVFFSSLRCQGGNSYIWQIDCSSRIIFLLYVPMMWRPQGACLTSTCFTKLWLKVSQTIAHFFFFNYLLVCLMLLNEQQRLHVQRQYSYCKV